MRRGLLPVISLVVVVAWALFAVAMLTGTLISTQQIDNRVRTINTVLPPINKNLQSIPLAQDTGRIAGEIGQAARPLGGQFTQVVGDVKGIEGSVQQILDRANQINGSVRTIQGGVFAIHDVVVPIGRKLSDVKDDVDSIHDSVHSIDHRFDKILDHSHSIDDGARGINDRAERVQDIVDDIKDDTGQLVHRLLPDINRNAFAISRSPLLLKRVPLPLNPLLAALKLPLPQLLARVPGSDPRLLPQAVGPVLPADAPPAPKLLGIPGPLGHSGSDSDDHSDPADHDSGPTLKGLLGSH